ncbi:MAG TPA: chemotaxis protein CheD [Tepidisphaeraceae bacterium]|nr:chemotaxis protein CheD [Tepidisphaeraceae bacterium]
MQITVSISDARVSSNVGDTLVTFSLGSCIGVAVYDPQMPAAGLLHFQLPSATMDAARAQQNPCMFGDSGLEFLLKQMEAKGANRKRLKVRIMGGAKMLADNSTFDIGKRNHTAIRKALWQHGLFLDKEDCGGTVPRTVYFNVADGRITMKRGGETVEL